MPKAVIGVLLIGICLLTVSCLAAGIWWVCWGPELMVHSNGLPPNRQFKLLTGLEPTPDVRDIEGIGGGWQGYRFWLRFRCNPSTVDRILAQGYERCSADELERKLNFNSHRRSFEPDHFTPEWEPGDCNNQQCYRIGDFKNEWTEHAFVWLAFDPSTGWVHMYSEGPD